MSSLSQAFLTLAVLLPIPLPAGVPAGQAVPDAGRDLAFQESEGQAHPGIEFAAPSLPLTGAAPPAAASLEEAHGVLRGLFDGGRGLQALSSPRSPSYERLRQIRQVLSLGTPQSAGALLPFTFRIAAAGDAGGGSSQARTAGLEGFVHAEAEVSRKHGSASIRHHLADYGRYLDALLAPVPWGQDARERVREIMESELDDKQKYEQMMGFVREYTEKLRKEAASVDAASWMREARVYEVFPRAFNLAGKRRAQGLPPGNGGPFFADLGTPDLLDIKAQGFDTVWVMGIFPIGERGRTGTGGGSPYSIKDHEGIHPDLGTEKDFEGFVRRAHQAGLRVVIDFVPNHTSMDSKLLMTRPEFFIHQEAGPGSPPHGWFEHTDPGSGRRLWVAHGGYEVFGSVSPWIDTTQVDYSRPALRREMTRIVLDWVRRTGVDGLRVDMAYLVLNKNFSRAWRRTMPEREFLEELITTVKSAYPETAFVAEGYGDWDELSQTGFDLIYSKNNMDRPGGHHGWYDALTSRDPAWIREGLKRAAFLQWQKGGSGGMDFIGNHDEASPARALGPWERGAATLTLLMPGSLLFYGSQEVGFDHPVPQEPKSLPFSVPVRVDWENADPQTAAFYRETLRTAARLRESLPSASMRVLEPSQDPGWVGYALFSDGHGRDDAGGASVVIANPTGRTVRVHARDAHLGVDWTGTLAPWGYRVVEPSARAP